LDPLIKSQLLYQLSYAPEAVGFVPPPIGRPPARVKLAAGVRLFKASTAAIYLAFTMRAALHLPPSMQDGFRDASHFILYSKPCQLRRARAPARQGLTMSANAIVKCVAAASVFAAILAATPAAAQRVIRGYGADENFQNQALAAGGYRQQRYDAYPQQRSSGNLGGGFLEFVFGGNRSPAGYGPSSQAGRPLLPAGCLRAGGRPGSAGAARDEPDLPAPRGRL
jgi:hypothetical protein